MSKTDHGTTFVNVGEEKYELKFTLKAVKGIEARFGGLAPAFQQLQVLNFAATAAVIAIGAGLSTKPKDLEALEEAIWDAGIGVVVPEVMPYLTAMLNPSARSAEEIEPEAEQGNA